MTIQELRQITGLSQSKFAKQYGIPVRTSQEWEQGKRKPPGYVLELLEFKVREDLNMESTSPEEFYQKMLKIKEDYEYDKEKLHGEMDDLMCEVLKSLGYGKGIGIFEDTDKWYS